LTSHPSSVSSSMHATTPSSRGASDSGHPCDDVRVALDSADDLALEFLAFVERHLELPDRAAAIEEKVEEPLVREVEEGIDRGQGARCSPSDALGDQHANPTGTPARRGTPRRLPRV
jgi:hypothetical protein